MTSAVAIETRYAGCRFRSRLEARWAVFFDSLNIQWEYEPQGFIVGEDKIPYLPDFWLPNQLLWIEVKGNLGEADRKKIEGAFHPTLGIPGIRRLMLLESIPEPSSATLHRLISRVDGHADSVPSVRVADAIWLPRKDKSHLPYPFGYPKSWADPMTKTTSWLNPCIRVIEAYRAARSARFEFGESG